MAVPDHIRKVPRPVNTIVEDNGRDGPNRYCRCPGANQHTIHSRISNNGICNNAMLSFEGVLEGIGDHVLYKKCCIKGGHYLYSYKSARKAAIEEANYLSRREKNKDFNGS